MTWHTILVPHDFSASANHALALARDEAKLHGANIVLVHMLDVPSHFGPEAVVFPPDTNAPIALVEYARATAEGHLRDLVDRLAHDGASITSEVRVGAAVDGILRAADELKADVIFMGTHGRTGVKHLLVGSVAERVVRGAKVPVVTVRQPDEG